VAITNNPNNPNNTADTSMTGTNRYGREIVDSSLGSLSSQLGDLVSQLKVLNQRQDEQMKRDRKFQEEMLKRDRSDSDSKRRDKRWDSDYDLSRPMMSMAKDLSELSKNLKSDVRSSRSDSWRAMPKSKTRADMQYLSAKQVSAVLDAYRDQVDKLNSDVADQIKAHDEFTSELKATTETMKKERIELANSRNEKRANLINELKIQRSETEDPKEIESVTRKILDTQAEIDREQYKLAQALNRLDSNFDKNVKDGIDRILQDNQKYLKDASDMREKELERIRDKFGDFEESASHVSEFSSNMRSLSPAFNKMMDDVDETYSEGFNRTKDTLISALEEEFNAWTRLLEADEKETDERKKLTLEQREQILQEMKINKMQMDYLRRTGPIQDIWKGAGVELKKTSFKMLESLADLGFKYFKDKLFDSLQEGFQKIYDSVENTRNEISARLKLSQGDFSAMQESIYKSLQETGLSGSLSEADVNEMLVSMQGAGITDTDMLSEFAIEAAKLKASGSSINLANEKTLQLMTGWYNRAIQSGEDKDTALKSVSAAMDRLSDYEQLARSKYGDAALVNGGIDQLINTLGDFEFSAGKSIEDATESMGKSLLDASQMYLQGYDMTEFVNSIQGMLDKQYSEYSSLENVMLMGGQTREQILSQGIDKSIEAMYGVQKTLLDTADNMYLPEFSQAYGLTGSMPDQRKMKVGERLDLKTPENIEQTLTDISETEKQALANGEYLSETEKVRTKRENQMTELAIKQEQKYKGDMVVNGVFDSIDGTVTDIYNILKMSLIKSGASILRDWKKGNILGRSPESEFIGETGSDIPIIGNNGGVPVGNASGYDFSKLLGASSLKEGAGQFLLGKSGTALGTVGKVAGGAVGAYWMVDSITDNIGESFQESFENIATDPKFYRGLGTTLGSAVAGPVGGAIGGVVGQLSSKLGNWLYSQTSDMSDITDAQLEAANRLSEAGISLSNSANAYEIEIQNAQKNITEQKEIFTRYDESQKKQFISQMEIDTTNKSTQDAFSEAVDKWEQIELRKLAEMELKKEAGENTSVLTASVGKKIDGSLFDSSADIQKKEIADLVESKSLSADVLSYIDQYGLDALSDSQKDIIDKAWKQKEEKRVDLREIQTEQGYKELGLVEEQALRNYAEQNKLYDANGAVDLENVRKIVASKGAKLDYESATKQLYAEQVKDGSITDTDIGTMTKYFDELQSNRNLWETDNAKFQKQWADIAKKNPGATIVDLVNAYNKEYLSGKGISVADVIEGFSVDSVGLSAQFTIDSVTGLPMLRNKSHSGTRMYDPSIYHNKFESGLTYVPYDNYPALLHEGERILTKEEAKSYNDLSSYLVSNLSNETIRYGDSKSTESITKLNTDDIKGTINRQTGSTNELLSQILVTLKDISTSLKMRRNGASFNNALISGNTNLTSLNT
jgi:hypothetical protein